MMGAGSRRNGRPVVWSLVAASLVALTIAITLLAGAPASLPASNFRGTVDTPPNCTVTCPASRPVSVDLPPSVEVTVRWFDVSGGGVQFSIWGPFDGARVCDESGAFGRCQFPSPYPGGNYTFHAAVLDAESGQQVTFTGYYG